MPSYDRLAILLSLVLLGTALSSVIEFPTRDVAFVVLGSSLTLNLSLQWLMAGILMALVCTGIDSMVRSHPQVRQTQIGYISILWVLPSLVTLAALFFLRQAPTKLMSLAGLAMMGVLLALIIIAEYRTIDLADPHYGAARLGLNLFTYIVAFVIYTTIYNTKTRSLVSATAILMASALLALEPLRATERDVTRTWLYALIAGVIMGEATWGLNYWGISTLSGGMLLLLIFYVITGLAQQQLWRRLTRGVLLEFALITLFGLGLLLRYTPWLR